MQTLPTLDLTKVRLDPISPLTMGDAALLLTRLTLLGLYQMDYIDLDNIRWPLLLKLAKGSRRFV